MRRLVVCFDGTWNTPDRGDNPTNVVKMVRAIRTLDETVSQITFYDKGVGTGGLLDRIVGAVSGAGLTENVIDGYRFLANNFVPGDEIYVFGFSRGAFTARSLVGLISMTGLLAPVHLGGALKDLVMGIYRNRELSAGEKREKVEALGLDRYEDVRICCIGVWDTVGSLGVPTDIGRQFLDGKFYFHDVELSEIVDVALHAVAIDEKRSAFSPTLWTRLENAPLPDCPQVVEQVWFPGVHSNIGGSYADAGLSDITFMWMVNRVAALTGLALNWTYIQNACATNVAGTGYESRSWPYKGSVVYPYQRLINQVMPRSPGIGGSFRRRFESLDRRNIAAPGTHIVNEAVHISAIERWNLEAVPHDCARFGECATRSYRPINLEAALQAHQNAGPRLKIVGWDGFEMKDENIPPVAE